MPAPPPEQSPPAPVLDPPTPARQMHIVVIKIMSWLGLVRLRRPWEQRARDGRVAFIFCVALCARRTREAVRSAAHGPAHPVDGSQPQNWARRIFPNGESDAARVGVPVRSHARVHTRCSAPHGLTLFAILLRSPSARNLERWRLSGWPGRSSDRGCRWRVHVSALRTGCSGRAHGWQSESCRVALCTHDIPGGTRA